MALADGFGAVLFMHQHYTDLSLTNQQHKPDRTSSGSLKKQTQKQILRAQQTCRLFNDLTTPRTTSEVCSQSGSSFFFFQRKLFCLHFSSHSLTRLFSLMLLVSLHLLSSCKFCRMVFFSCSPLVRSNSADFRKPARSSLLS